MIRTVAFIQRRRGLGRGAFRDHYEGQHVPLALPRLPGLEHYVRNFVRREDGPAPIAFDAISEFEYRDQAAFGAMSAMLEGTEGDLLRADEARFMNKPGNSFFRSDRLGITTGSRPPPGTSPKAIAVVRSRGATSRRALAEQLGAVGDTIASAAGTVHVEMDVARDGAPSGERAWDALLHVWYCPGTSEEEALGELAERCSRQPQHCRLWIDERGDRISGSPIRGTSTR